MNQDGNRKLLPVVIVALFISAVVLFAFTRQKNTGDVLPEDSKIDISSQVEIDNGQEVINSLGSVEAYDSLSEDLYTFAKTAYSEYSTAEAIVTFEVVEAVQTKDKEITFQGKFGSVDQKISVKVVPLKNRRVATSVTDTKTNLNIDQFLPSNKRRNQYIGTLPFSTDTYSIDYVSMDDSFSVSLYSENRQENDASYIEALSKITAGLGMDALDYEKITSQRPSSSFGF